MKSSAVRLIAVLLASCLASCDAGKGNDADTSQKSSRITLPGDLGGETVAAAPNLTAAVLPSITPGTFFAQYLDPPHQCSPGGLYSHVMALTSASGALQSVPDLCNPGAPASALSASLFKSWSFAPRHAKYDNRILMRKNSLSPYPGGADNGGDPKAVILCDSDVVSTNDQVIAFHQAIGEPIYGTRYWKKSGDNTNYVSNHFPYSIEAANGDLHLTSDAAVDVRIFLGQPLGPNKFNASSTVRVAYPGTAVVTETLPVTCLVYTGN